MTAKAPPTPEADFATFVEAAFEQFRWRWYHTYNSQRSRAGFPDYVAVKGVSVLFIEIKGVDANGRPGRLTGEQIAWVEAFQAGGCPVPDCPATHAESDVWRPGDTDAIIERLSR